MAITYDGTRITVTGTGNTYEDLYNADVANGWGVVTRQCSQYCINTGLVIGDGSTESELIDEGVQVQIGSVDNYISDFRILENATFQLGNLNNGSYDTQYGLNGNSLTIYQGTAYTGFYLISPGDFKLYGCSLCILCDASTGYRIRLTGGIDLRDVNHSGNGTLFLSGTGTLHRNTYSNSNAYGFMCYTAGLDISDLIVQNKNLGLVCGFSSLTVNATNMIVNDNLAYHIQMNPYSDNIFNMYDCDYDIYKIRSYIVNDPTYTPAICYDYKSFNLRVLDGDFNPIEGATVTLTDNQGNVVELTTDSNGEIEEQNLLRMSCQNNQEVGTGVGTTYNDYVFYTPWTVKVEYSGNYDYIGYLDLALDLHKKGVNWTVVMKSAPVVDEITPTFYHPTVFN